MICIYVVVGIWIEVRVWEIILLDWMMFFISEYGECFVNWGCYYGYIFIFIYIFVVM